MAGAEIPNLSSLTCCRFGQPADCGWVRRKRIHALGVNHGGVREMESTDEGRSVQRVSEPAPDMSARTAARPASSRATGTRGGEQET